MKRSLVLMTLMIFLGSCGFSTLEPNTPEHVKKDPIQSEQLVKLFEKNCTNLEIGNFVSYIKRHSGYGFTPHYEITCQRGSYVYRIEK